MGSEAATEFIAHAMPTNTPPNMTTTLGPYRSTNHPSIGMSHVSVSTNRLNATWMAARPQ
jgi:hypothetical protein